MNPTVEFTETDHQTWKLLFSKQESQRDLQLIPEFGEGLNLLGITGERIPDLQEVNRKLRELTGWEGVYVKGFVEPKEFFHMLSERKFPVGSFIRDPKDLSYTPEPDVFHDLYGHLPFYTMKNYGDFCCEFGKRAYRYADVPEIVEEFQRLFWFAVEFGLVMTPRGRRIFGAGIASSFTECAYALSDLPKVMPFHLDLIRSQPFRIDILQDKLFVLENEEQLYNCLDDFEETYQSRYPSQISKENQGALHDRK